MLFTALQSQHIRHVSSFFGTSRTGTAQRLKLSLICPFAKSSSTWLCNSLVSSGLHLYVGRIGAGMKSI